MKKLPACKLCGKQGHYQYQCYLKAKTQLRKTSLKPSNSRSKPLPVSKTIKDPSRKKVSRQTLIRRLDKVVSRYVRLKYADKNGMARCYTCGKVYNWKIMDNGHYFSRKLMPTRFDPANCRIQCISCNRYLRGNYDVYRKKMKAELGEKKYKELWQKANSRQKISTPMLEVMLAKAEQSLKALEEQKKNIL